MIRRVLGFFGGCTHPHRLCIHGDAAMSVDARAICLDCDRRFAVLPERCSITGAPHRRA